MGKREVADSRLEQSPPSAYRLLRSAVGHVPQVRFAIGVVGFAAAAAITMALFNNLLLALVATSVMFMLSVILVIFVSYVRQMGEVNRGPAKALPLIMLPIFMAILILSLASIFFNWPLPIGESMIRHLDPDSRSERPTTPPLEVSVLGFRNLSGQGAEWISFLLSDRVETELAGGDGIHVPRRDGPALEGISARTGGCLSEGDLRRVRESHGVNFVVTGSYLVYGDPPDSLLQLDICIQDARTAQTLATKSLRTRPEEVSAVASDVVAFLRTSLGLAPVPQNDASVPATHHSASVEATEAYYEGLLYLQHYDPLLAKDSFERALSADPGYAVAHAGLAEAWSLLGYDDEARKSAHKALELLAGVGAPSARLSTDPFGEFQMIRARAHESAWEWDEAIAAYRGLWEFASHTGRPEAKDYGLLLLSAQIKGERMKGAAETISWLHKIPLSRIEAVEVTLAEAAAARSFGDREEQAKQAAKAARIAQELRAPLLAARANLFWCDALVSLESYQEGILRCEAARQQFVGVGDVLNTAKTESVIAVANALQGDFDAAMHGFQKIRNIFDTTGYGRGIAEQLNNLANLVGERGSWRQAKKILLEARRIAGERDDHRLLAEISVNLAGIVFWDEREYSDALSLYRSALVSYERIGAKEKAFLTRGDIAYMLQVQGEHLGARKEYEEACRGLERLRSQGADAADVLLRFARLCVESGDNQRARRLLLSARRYYRINGEAEREAMMQSDLNEILGGGPPEWQQILRLPLTDVPAGGSPCS
jgi:tetratricopeptide (TPR) repeat protein